MTEQAVHLKDKLTWSVGEAAAMCGISDGTMRKWIREGIMPRPHKLTRRLPAVAVKDALRAQSGEGLNAPLNGYDSWKASQ